MPELITAGRQGKWWIHLITQNIGMIIGIAIMLVIAVFEEHIVHLG